MKTLYIHVPFCERKCFYCSFVISVGQEHRMDDYLSALETEAERFKNERVRSIYIGGGTPTLMDSHRLAKLTDMVRRRFSFSSNTEWTVEANPEGLTGDKLRVMKQAGINRISLGVQTLNDAYLKYLGRNHDAAAAVNAYHRIREAGFDNVNLDLMFAFPGQTLKELQRDVKAVTALKSDHLSLYSLTIEPNSRFYARGIALDNDGIQRNHYVFICEALDRAGYEQYEVSNFARPGKNSRHNRNYWQGGEYIGLGIGAHSYTDSRRSWNVTNMNRYIDLMNRGLSVEEGYEKLQAADRMKELLLFGLRMNRGVDVGRIEKAHHVRLSAEQKQTIERFIEGGFLVREDNKLKTSLQGRLVLDELCAQLI